MAMTAARPTTEPIIYGSQVIGVGGKCTIHLRLQEEFEGCFSCQRGRVSLLLVVVAVCKGDNANGRISPVDWATHTATAWVLLYGFPEQARGCALASTNSPFNVFQRRTLTGLTPGKAVYCWEEPCLEWY